MAQRVEACTVTAGLTEDGDGFLLCFEDRCEGEDGEKDVIEIELEERDAAALMRTLRTLFEVQAIAENKARQGRAYAALEGFAIHHLQSLLDRIGGGTASAAPACAYCGQRIEGAALVKDGVWVHPSSCDPKSEPAAPAAERA